MHSWAALHFVRLCATIVQEKWCKIIRLHKRTTTVRLSWRSSVAVRFRSKTNSLCESLDSARTMIEPLLCHKNINLWSFALAFHLHNRRICESCSLTIARKVCSCVIGNKLKSEIFHLNCSIAIGWFKSKYFLLFDTKLPNWYRLFSVVCSLAERPMLSCRTKKKWFMIGRSVDCTLFSLVRKLNDRPKRV